MKKKATEQAQAIRDFAGKLPGVTSGVACKGTALESTTFAVRKKNFLFLQIVAGSCRLRLKITDSRSELETLAKKEPDRYDIGAQGWAKVAFPLDTAPPFETVRRWIDESYRAFA